MVRWLVIALLVALTCGLAPLAFASPPDQSWLGGFFDDADYDDVVVSVTSAVSVVESQTFHDTGPVQTVVDWTIQLDECAPARPALSTNSSRAPPTA
jgi:hypothetical protein